MYELLILSGVNLYTQLLCDRLGKFNKIYGRNIINLVSFYSCLDIEIKIVLNVMSRKKYYIAVDTMK